MKREVGEIGKRIDLVRYSAKHDVVPPRDLLSACKGGPIDEFAESVSRIVDDQKRKRSAVGQSSDCAALMSVPNPNRNKHPN